MNHFMSYRLTVLMSNTKTFDLIVIGTGTAVASKCHSAGWGVAVIEGHVCSSRM